METQQTKVMTKKEVVNVWFNRVWSQEDQSAIDQMFDPDGRAEGLGDGPMLGPEDFKPFHTAICALLKNINIRVNKVIEEGNWVSNIYTLTAVTHKTDITISVEGSAMCRIEGGVIREAYNHLDFLGLFGQLGFLPPDALMTGLTGQKIV